MKNCYLFSTRSMISCMAAGHRLVMIFAVLILSLNLNAQTANLTQDDDADFNKGYLNDMVVTSNTVALPYKATAWGSYTETGALPKALRNHQATYWNNLVFVTGGLEVIGYELGAEVVDYSSTVYVGDVGEGLTNWREENALPAGVSEHAAVVANGYLYVIGGLSNDLPSDKIYYAKLRADGTLREWQESATLLPYPLWGHTAGMVNGRLFVIGGSNTADTTAVNVVYSSQVNPDGTLSAFTTETNTLPANRNNHSMVTYNNRIYILGGYDETLVPANTVYYADVAMDGTLGAWLSGGTLPEPLYAHASTLQNGVITLLGGYNDDQYYSVQHAYMADITTGPSFSWVQSGLYFEHWASSAAFATDGKIFTVGGIDIFDNTLSQCYYNTLSLSGTERASSGRFLSQVYELGIDRSISTLDYRVLNASAHSFYYRIAADGDVWNGWTNSTGLYDISIADSKRYVQYLFEISGVTGDHQEALDSAQLNFAAIQLAGTYSTDQTWTQANSPYWVTDNVILNGNATITVEAGASLTFSEGTMLEVQDAVLNCEGNSEGYITFTSFTGEDGFWKGLHFTSASSGHNSTMNYVIIENAGFQDNANLNVWSSDQPTINTGTLQLSTNSALYVNGGWPVLNDVTFADNKAYVIRVEAGGTGDIINPVFTGNETDAVLVVSSTIANNAFWDNFGLDYDIAGNISVYGSSWNPRLTIAHGLTLRFPAGSGISVGGNYYSGGELWAEGSADPDSMITFTSLNGQAGGWKGIYFDAGSDDYGSMSSLKYCLIEKGSDYNIHSNYTGQPTLENCTITNSLHKGIILTNSSPTIINCEVYGHPEEGLYGDNYCDASITGSDFHNNGGEGFICGGNLTIMNTDFHDNTGAGLHLTGYAPNVENVVIQNNGSHGLYVTDCDPDFVNVDVLNNTGHGFYMNANVWPEYYDLVLSGNATNDFRVDGGIVNHAVTWQLRQYPYIVIGTFSIAGARLTLEKGLTLKFAAGNGIEIGGYYSGGELWAEGSAEPDSMITFTSLNGEAGGWNGINFNGWSSYNESVSSLKYCIIENGNDYNISAETTSQPVLENCTITNSLHKGIVLYYASPTITNCEVYGHPEEGLYGISECNASITGSGFYNNGGDGLNSGGNLFILNSTFHDNTGTGLHLTGNEPSIENVVIQDNGSHGLYVTDCDPDFINVDVLNNAGHGFYMNANVWPEYFDLVLSGNATNDFRVDGGTVSHGVTWQLGEYPFIIIGSFSIGGARLTLEKGLTLRFAEGTGIDVGGYYSGGELWAEGAAYPDSLITFTALNGEVGGWNGINFNYWADYNESVSSLKNCIVEKGNDYNIRTDQSNQTSIDSCIIREAAKYGVEIYYASPLITHSQIVNNTSYGIYIESESNPVIGNTMGEGNDIFNNGQYEIYNNSSNDISAAYNFWGTTDDARIQERIYDYNDNAGVGTVLYATASTGSLGLLGHYLSLKAKYANQSGTILDNVYVTATGLSQSYDFTSRTNQDGFSTFTMMPDQDYDLSYSTQKPWAGANGTDALKVMQHFAAISTLSGIQLAAADVNASESVNSTDAMLIMQRFAHLIDSFAAGDWVFESDGGNTLNISGADISDTIRGLCYGDVNGSYLPASQLKSDNYPVMISRKGEIATSGNIVDIPVYTSKDMQLGAISLIIYYPEEMLDIEDLRINHTGGQLLYNAENGTLLIAWISLDPMQVNTADPLLYITVNIKDMDAVQQDLTFIPGAYSELADGNASVIPAVELYYPAIVKASVTSTTEIPTDMGFGLSIYPNPFSTHTNLQYTLSEAGTVSLKIYNSLGKLVDVVVEDSRDAGSYTVQWSAEDHSSGIYYYILVTDTGKNVFRQSGKLILKRQ